MASRSRWVGHIRRRGSKGCSSDVLAAGRPAQLRQAWSRCRPSGTARPTREPSHLRVGRARARCATQFGGSALVIPAAGLGMALVCALASARCGVADTKYFPACYQGGIAERRMCTGSVVCPSRRERAGLGLVGCYHLREDRDGDGARDPGSDTRGRCGGGGFDLIRLWVSVYCTVR